MSPRISYDELAKQNVAKLLKYATERLFLDEADYFYAQNQLLDALKIQEPGQYSDIQVGDIYDVVENLSAYAARKSSSTRTNGAILKQNSSAIACPPQAKSSKRLTTLRASKAWTRRATICTASA